jgi:hypothetical protein
MHVQVAQLVGEVIPTRVQLSFSQLQNFAADVAAERNLSYYFWGHVDAAVLASREGALFADEALGCMDRIAAEQPSWGVVYFRYDTFAAFRTDVARAVRWDTFIHHYLSDCDWCAACIGAPQRLPCAPRLHARVRLRHAAGHQLRALPKYLGRHASRLWFACLAQVSARARRWLGHCGRQRGLQCL